MLQIDELKENIIGRNKFLLYVTIARRGIPRLNTKEDTDWNNYYLEQFKHSSASDTASMRRTDEFKWIVVVSVEVILHGPKDKLLTRPQDRFIGILFVELSCLVKSFWTVYFT